MIGLVGRCEVAVVGDPSEPKGKVFVRGEYWNSTSDEPIAVGEAVEVVSLEGLTVQVKKLPRSS
jgi:membrane-bound serine protease (ClpP class)